MYDIKNLSKMKNLETHAPEAMKAFVAFDKAAVGRGVIRGDRPTAHVLCGDHSSRMVGLLERGESATRLSISCNPRA